MKKDKRVSSYL